MTKSKTPIKLYDGQSYDNIHHKPNQFFQLNKNTFLLITQTSPTTFSFTLENDKQIIFQQNDLPIDYLKKYLSTLTRPDTFDTPTHDYFGRPLDPKYIVPKPPKFSKPI